MDLSELQALRIKELAELAKKIKHIRQHIWFKQARVDC